MATKVTGELYESITGQLFEIGRQLRQKNGYPFDPETLKRHIQAAIEGRFDQASKRITRLIVNEPLILDAVNGSETLVNATDLFTYIDSDSEADEPGQPTEKTPVVVREMCNDASFAQMFGELNPDVGKLCFSQHQIKNFVKKHREHLRTIGYATFFLFKSRGNFFVADVSAYSNDELGVRVARFEDADVWCAKYRLRLVVPQL